MDINTLKSIFNAATQARKALSDNGYKYCALCEDVLPLDDFNTSHNSSDGRYSYCKQCSKAKNRDYKNRGHRSKPRKPYENRTRPSEFAGCIEVKMYGDNDRWMVLDTDVFEMYSDVKFYLSRGGRDLYYCVIRPNTTDEKIHRLICDVGSGLDVDHINHNGLDNRRTNLRAVTRKENLMNRRPFNSKGLAENVERGK